MKQKEEKTGSEALELPDWIKDTPQNREYVKRILELNYIKDVDGFYYLNLYDVKGLMGSNDLKIVAWHLDKLNKPYEENIEDYFEKERQNDV